MSKGNWEAAHSSKNDCWRTPDDVYLPLHKEFDFVLDAAADAANARCPDYIDRAKHALSDTPWMSYTSATGSIWCNPPYGRYVGLWLKRAYEAAQRSDCSVVCLVMASTETRWWAEWVWKASEVRFLTGRVHFLDENGLPRAACPKGSAIAVFDPGYDGPPKVSLWKRKPV